MGCDGSFGDGPASVTRRPNPNSNKGDSGRRRVQSTAYVSIAFPTVVRRVQRCQRRVAAALPTTLLASVCLLHGVATRAATFAVIGSPKCGVRLGCEATHPSERDRAEIWSCSLAFWLSWSLFRKRNSSPGSKYKEHLSERGRTVVSRNCGGNFSVWETSYCIMSWIVYIYSCQQGFYHTENVFIAQVSFNNVFVNSVFPSFSGLNAVIKTCSVSVPWTLIHLLPSSLYEKEISGGAFRPTSFSSYT